MPINAPLHRWMMTEDANDTAPDGTVSLLHFDAVKDETGKVLVPYGGCTTSATQSRFGGRSIYFDGTNDVISVANHPDLVLGTSNFTVSFWYYPTKSSGYADLFMQGYYAATTISVQLTGLVPHLMVGQTDFASSITLVINTWSHIEIGRNGNNFYLFINGQVAYTTTSSMNISWTGATTFGDFPANSWPAQGYMDEILVLKNTVLHTANFTVPSAPFVSDANTVFLYHAEDPTLQTGLVDESGKVWTASNGILNSANRSMFGGSSLYVPNVSNAKYLTPASSDFDFGTGIFTIDFWFYPTAYAELGLVSTASTPGTAYAVWGTPSSHILNFTLDCGNSQLCSTSNTYTINQWNHCAVVKKGSGATDIGIAINGVFGTWVSGNQTINSAGAGMSVGNLYITTTYSANECYYDEVRISKGIARWTTNFTPPTSAYTTTNPGPVINLTNNGSVTFGADGASFNGSSQWLSGTITLPATFTFSVWARLDSVAARQVLMGTSSGSTNITALDLGISGYSYFLVGTSSEGNGAGVADYNATNYPSNTHVLVTGTYDGTTIKLYRGSTLIAQKTYTAGTLATNFSIGRLGNNTGQYVDGYERDARIYNYPLTASEIAALVAASDTTSGVHPMPIFFF